MPTLQELATETRKINAANGWATDWSLDRLGIYLDLIQTEVTEAYRAQPVHRQEEFADIIIRALDLCELIEPELVGKVAPYELLGPLPVAYRIVQSNYAANYLQIHCALTDVHEVYRKEYREPGEEPMLRRALVLGLVCAISLVVQFDEALGGRALEDVLLAKLEKNRTRGFRHGGRRS